MRPLEGVPARLPDAAFGWSSGHGAFALCYSAALARRMAKSTDLAEACRVLRGMCLQRELAPNAQGSRFERTFRVTLIALMPSPAVRFREWPEAT